MVDEPVFFVPLRAVDIQQLVAQGHPHVRRGDLGGIAVEVRVAVHHGPLQLQLAVLRQAQRRGLVAVRVVLRPEGEQVTAGRGFDVLVGDVSGHRAVIDAGR